MIYYICPGIFISNPSNIHNHIKCSSAYMRKKFLSKSENQEFWPFNLFSALLKIFIFHLEVGFLRFSHILFLFSRKTCLLFFWAGLVRYEEFSFCQYTKVVLGKYSYIAAFFLLFDMIIRKLCTALLLNQGICGSSFQQIFTMKFYIYYIFVINTNQKNVQLLFKII